MKFYRPIIFLTFALLLGLFFSFISAHDGMVYIRIPGWQIEISQFVLSLTILTTLVLIWLSAGAYYALSFLPERRKLRKERQAYSRLTAGFAALSAGDIETAKRLAVTANRMLKNVPLLHVLQAEIAERISKPIEQEEHLKALLDFDETKIMATIKLIRCYHQQGNALKAASLATQAHESALHPSLFVPEVQYALSQQRSWQALLDFTETELVKQQWWQRKKTINKNYLQLKHGKALALFMLSNACSAEQSDEAFMLNKRAHMLMPEFLPATISYTKKLISKGRKRDALKALARAWKVVQHPELVQTLLSICEGIAVKQKIRDFEKTFDGAYRHTITLNVLADLYQDINQTEKAVALRTQAASLPKPYFAWECSVCHHTSKNWQEACASCGAIGTTLLAAHASAENSHSRHTRIPSEAAGRVIGRTG